GFGDGFHGRRTGAPRGIFPAAGVVGHLQAADFMGINLQGLIVINRIGLQVSDQQAVLSQIVGVKSSTNPPAQNMSAGGANVVPQSIRKSHSKQQRALLKTLKLRLAISPILRRPAEKTLAKSEAPRRQGAGKPRRLGYGLKRLTSGIEKMMTTQPLRG